jgi:hypothetical protein
MENIPEFQALKNEEGRMQAWEKHMKRLKVRILLVLPLPTRGDLSEPISA